MISVAEAKKIIHDHTQSLTPVTMPLKEAVGMVLAEDCFAGSDIPGFPQSAMDGYAFAFDSWKQKTLLLQGEIPAGRGDAPPLEAGTAVRIFTGAAVPENADTVVMQEKTRVENGQLIIEDDLLEKGGNVRPKGSEMMSGALAIPQGNVLTAASIGFLAGLGIHEVNVYPKPKISIVVTGNELQQPGQPLEFGQVYESNSYTLTAVLQTLHLEAASVVYAADDLSTLQETLKFHLETSDVLLITGGVSVGDYDFVSKALENCGVEKHFHKIKQKPGKPLFFGTLGNKLVFGLPGNPSSVLTCFYEYTWPALEQMMHMPHSKIIARELPLARGYTKKPGLTHFLKGLLLNDAVIPLDAQESYRMRSFATANCFIILEEEGTEYHTDDIVTVHILPA
ncbi:molybdopterin molybdotransferase MoeA [Taibaiella soli]|uniref:Molybdopterin molybdenumtransferase n=1 Tax=Taibaiella soli TaxID=1649169 RepID=A0A2W2AQ46_9BACT|nr:gephyrin-like molybdotransferase Glp [Taibaiella soli]PZF74540.1 molybdopterin molybdenumtransferase MoeA [Taibaiella soli]